MRVYLPHAFLCEQNENTNLLQGYTKKVIFGVTGPTLTTPTVIFGVFANIYYICTTKNSM